MLKYSFMSFVTASLQSETILKCMFFFLDYPLQKQLGKPKTDECATVLGFYWEEKT